MVTDTNLLALTEQIDKVFKSLIKSGRPDILNEDNNQSIVPELYTDLFSNDYILRQTLDDNHTILKGRRGTGKSTIFLKAEYELKEKYPSKLPVYINLQTSFETVRGANIEENSIHSAYLTYRNFLTDILLKVKEKISNKSGDQEINQLFEEIKEGQYLDKDFERVVQLSASQVDGNKKGVKGQLNLKSIGISGDLSAEHNSNTTISIEKHEYRIFSINDILKKLSHICQANDITKIYLFLDDFSELSRESQKVIVDSLIAPIISSYNELFVVKIAAYPGRIYKGNIDKTKLPSHSLDFYDAYDLSSQTYNSMEKDAKQYINRALTKRLNYYTDEQLEVQDLFAIDETNNIESYLELLFYASFANLRALGFILSYCYLSSINEGKRITKKHIDRAAQKYYEENVLSDFINDARFKQSFHDDKSLLDQIAQKGLHDKIIENQFNLKRDIVDKYKNGESINKLFTQTLNENKTGKTIFYFPTSHFTVDKTTEKLLKTLELYFIVNKFNEVSVRWAPGKELATYGLNYGLCLKNNIDYGRPQFRRTYDYWRQEEFYINDLIHEILTSIEKIKCTECGEEYTEDEYKIYLKRTKCFECGTDNTVIKINKFEDKLQEKMEKWNQKKLPDSHMDILRVLYNSEGSKLPAYEIALQIDKYHIVVTNAMRYNLVPNGLVRCEERERRYYSITDKARSIYFTNEDDLFE